MLEKEMLNFQRINSKLIHDHRLMPEKRQKPLSSNIFRKVLHIRLEYKKRKR